MHLVKSKNISQVHLKIDSNKKLKKFFREEFQKIRDANQNTRKVSEYFGEIGSTKIEDIEYSDQLKVKQSAITNILGIEGIEIVESPQIERYRYKMEFVCSYNPFYEPNNRFGQRKEKKFNWVVDLHDCILVPHEWFAKVRKVFEFFVENNIEIYDLVSYKGNLRYIVLRNFQNQSALTVVSKEILSKELMQKAWDISAELGFSGIDFIVNSTITDVTTGELISKFGNSDLEIQLLDRKFIVGSSCFFQNNILGFELLVKYVQELALKIPTENKKILYDLYCGVGTFGILFSESFDYVLGIDNVPENIEYLKKNLEINNVQNYKYSTGDLNSKDLEFEVIKNQTLIVDPPRSGLQKNGVEHVLKLEPEFIVYISCNPITQEQDLEIMKEFYSVVEAKSFDLFPLTYHMENVVFLKKKE